MIKKEKKNVWLAEEKEVQGRKKEEIFWRRKIFGQWRRRRTRGKGIKTRSSWLNCALRDDEAVYSVHWVSIGHYESVAVDN